MYKDHYKGFTILLQHNWLTSNWSFDIESRDKKPLRAEDSFATHNEAIDYAKYIINTFIKAGWWADGGYRNV